MSSTYYVEEIERNLCYHNPILIDRLYLQSLNERFKFEVLTWRFFIYLVPTYVFSPNCWLIYPILMKFGKYMFKTWRTFSHSISGPPYYRGLSEWGLQFTEPLICKIIMYYMYPGITENLLIIRYSITVNPRYLSKRWSCVLKT
jgi:hypothetical protein